MNTETKRTQVESEVMEAYADCWLEWEEGHKRRNLNFIASDLVTRDEAIEILQKAIPDGYNAFDPKSSLNQFDAGSRIQIAREFSVCLYLRGGELPHRIEADEVDTRNGITRVWWD